MAHEVTFERGSHTLASARKLTITGSWAALLTLQHYVSRIEAEGARMQIPAEMPPPEPPAASKRPPATVGEMVANGGVLEIARTPAETPLTFTFAKLNLRNVSEKNAIQFDADFTIPEPPGRLLTSGSVGPWRHRDTPVMGSFRMQDGRLGAFNGIDGTLSANGKFNGILQKVHVSGHTDVPDFRVKRHRVRLQTDYSATVNGFTGDVYLHSVEAKFLGTLLQAKAAIESKAGEDGKTVYADFTSNRAQIQDLMLLVTKADQPALNGPITLRAHVVLPPGKDEFLRKVRLDGDFGIDDASFTKMRTQTKVSELSARARGESVGANDPAPDRVVSDLTGHVVLRNGSATLTKCLVLGARRNGKGAAALTICSNKESA